MYRSIVLGTALHLHVERATLRQPWPLMDRGTDINIQHDERQLYIVHAKEGSCWVCMAMDREDEYQCAEQ
jgi:hypothetical protein